MEVTLLMVQAEAHHRSAVSLLLWEAQVEKLTELVVNLIGLQVEMEEQQMI